MLKKERSKTFYSTLLFITLFAANTFAATWDVPADKKTKNSYIVFDKTTQSEGQAIYDKNCKSCHGDLGKDNSMKSLNPIPPDLSSAGTQALTDGELQYILTIGRTLMPSFKDILPESDRWKVIGYMRSMNKSYVQVVSKTDPNKSKLVKVDFAYDSLKNVVTVSVVANEKSGVVALKNAEVGLFITRYFGKLQVEKAIKTDDKGLAIFHLGEKLPGDKAGDIELIAKINDENYGEIEGQKKFRIGIPTDVPGLTSKRAIWGTLKNAPIWIICLYLTGIFAFLSLLIYLLLSLKKIHLAGKKEK